MKHLIQFQMMKIEVCLLIKNNCVWVIEISSFHGFFHINTFLNEPRYEISNNVVCATSKASDQPAYTRSLIRTFVSHLNIL